MKIKPSETPLELCKCFMQERPKEWDSIMSVLGYTRPKPSVEWPSLKDEVANGDGKGKTDEWSIGWNEAVKVCQAAVEAVGLEYELDEKKVAQCLFKYDQLLSASSQRTYDGYAHALKLAERELITRKEK